MRLGLRLGSRLLLAIDRLIIRLEELLQIDLVYLVDPFPGLAIPSLQEEYSIMNPRVVPLSRLVDEVIHLELSPLGSREVERPAVRFDLRLEIDPSKENDIVHIMNIERKVLSNLRDFIERLLKIVLVPFHCEEIQSLVLGKVAIEKVEIRFIVSANDLIG